MLTREHMAEPTLLIVEPDEGTRAVMERDLRHRYGDRYRVLTAVSEDEALGTLDRLNAAQEPLALLLVAQRLPKATGVEFLEQASPRVPRAKRVLVTTFEDAEAAIDAIKTVRIDHYLVKPWQPPELHHYPVLDVRHGSVKRVATGVGEGAAAVQFIHQCLRSTPPSG